MDSKTNSYDTEIEKNGTSITNNKSIRNNHESLKLKIKLNVLLISIVSVFLFIIGHYINGTIPILPELPALRIFLIEYIIICNFLLAIMLLHIRIKKPMKNEKLGDAYMRMGWFVIKLSHHKKNKLEHEIKVGDYYICTGCFGGLLGLMIGGVIGVVYLFYFEVIITSLGFILWMIGILFTAISFMKYVFKIRNANRFFINASLTAGIWFLIIGADIFFKNVLFIMYFFTVISFLGFEIFFDPFS